MNAQSNPTSVVDEAFILRLFRRMDTQEHRRHSGHVTDDVVLESSFAEGTNSYVDADGKKVRVRLCDLYDFRDGKVVSKRVYTKRIIPE